MPPSRRTLIFGLDGFDFDFARQLADRGELPWLGSMLKAGSLIETHAPALPGSEWVNAACGVSAAHHGYLHTSQLRVGTYESVETNARVVRGEPFYEPLARSGLETIVVDLCVDRPRPQKNLVQVIDWATEFQLWHYCTTPRSERRFVDTVCPGHPLTNYGTTDPAESSLIELDRKLEAGAGLKARLIRALMSQHPDWDVFFAGFCEIHKAGHFFWQYQDPTHPGYAGSDHPLAHALRRQYRILDRNLEAIAQSVEPSTNLLLVADRGMRANLRGDHLIEPVLVRLGLLEPGKSQAAPSGAGTADEAPAEPYAKPLARRIKEQVPVALRPLLRRLTGNDRYHWARTRVFPLAEVGNTYLRVNLQGREPQGIVASTEYDALLELLERELRALINPATGAPVVADVVRPRETFAGPLRDHLPDLGIVWRGDAPVTAVESQSVGRIEGSHHEQRSGNHTERGGILVSGPSFQGGARRAGDLRELAPTVLALHGIVTPQSYEALPMPELRWSGLDGAPAALAR